MNPIRSIAWRLRNLYLFWRAYLHAFLGNISNQKIPTNPKKIVIVQGARLGDMVCTTPIFRTIKERYPECQIVVLGDKVNRELLTGHPHVDRYIVWKNNFREVLRVLRAECADFGIVCLPSLEALSLLILGNTRCIVAPRIEGGTSPYETSTYRALLRFVKTVPHYFDHYVPREYLRLLEPISITADSTKKYLTFSEEARLGVRQILEKEGLKTNEKLVGILPGVGGDPLKLWAPEKFAKLADYVSRKFLARPIILGSGKDFGAVRAMLLAISPQTKAVNLFNKISIDELKALTASLSLFISADTGPIYIAEAFDIPTIDILGPVKEFVQPPRDARHQVVFAPREIGVLGVLDNITSNRVEARRQSDAITVEMVTPIIDELLKGGPYFSATT